MREKIKHNIVKFRQFLYDFNEIIKDSSTVVFALIGIGFGLLFYVPFFILYIILMYSSDFLYGSLNGFKRNKK